LIVSGRFLYLPNYIPIPGLLQLINGAGVACLQNTIDDLADMVATVYSQASLGGAAGVFMPVENVKEWTQQTVLLTRIPFVPLFILAILNSIYAVIGILLGIVGVVNILGGHSVGAVQAKLSVWGLVEHAFEGGNQIIEGGEPDRPGDHSVVIGVGDPNDDGNLRFRKFYS
jgi:hypothetical protein